MCVYRCALEQERRDEKCEDMCALRLRRERFLDKKIKQKHRRQKAEKRGKPRQTTDLRDFVPQGQKNKKLSPKPLSSLSLSVSLSVSCLSLSLLSLSLSISLSCLSRRNRLSFACFCCSFFSPERERTGLLFTGKEGSSSLARESLSSRAKKEERIT